MRFLCVVGLGCWFLACGGSDSSGPFEGPGGVAGDKGAAGANSGSAGTSNSAGSSSGSGGGIGSGGASAGGSSGSSGEGGSSSGADASAGSGGTGTDVHDASLDRKAGDSGIMCGTKVCEQGQYCCNALCSICAPMGAACVQACIQGSGKGCTAEPEQDKTCAEGKPPHYYRCVFPYEQPSGCVQVLVGNATDGYCCP